MDILMWFFLGTLTLMGVTDFFIKQVPIWMIIINAICAFLLAAEHPNIAIASAGMVGVLLLLRKVGMADRIVLPAFAAVLPYTGVIIVLATYMLSLAHVRWIKSGAPMLFYLWVVATIYVVAGGPLL
jgi:hypothetical protein